MGTLNLSPNANQDYVLFSPNGAETTHIIDKCGRLIHQWETDGRPGLMAYFTDNGDLVRTRRHQTGEFLGGGIGGIIERFDWEGNMLWTDTLASPSHHQHHDIAVMPNGNILAILWEKWFAEDAIARGQLPDLASEEVGSPAFELPAAGYRQRSRLVLEPLGTPHPEYGSGSSELRRAVGTP